MHLPFLFQSNTGVPNTSSRDLINYESLECTEYRAPKGEREKGGGSSRATYFVNDCLEMYGSVEIVQDYCPSYPSIQYNASFAPLRCATTPRFNTGNDAKAAKNSRLQSVRASKAI